MEEELKIVGKTIRVQQHKNPRDESKAKLQQTVGLLVVIKEVYAHAFAEIEYALRVCASCSDHVGTGAGLAYSRLQNAACYDCSNGTCGRRQPNSRRPQEGRGRGIRGLR